MKDLPAKRYQTISVNGLDKATREACDAALEALDAIGADLDGAEALTELTKHGVAFELMSRARAALATAKTPHLLDLVSTYEDAHEPVVVFSAHRAPIDALAQRDGWAAITGSTKPEDRTRIEDRFQRGELRGVACTIQAGGVAITLTHASNAIFCDRLFTPSLNTQAEDRIHRIGQDRGVLIVNLVAEHRLDERLHEILVEKQTLIGASVDRATRQAAEADEADLAAAVKAALAAVSNAPIDDSADSETAYQQALAALCDELKRRDEELAAQGREAKWEQIVSERLASRGIECKDRKAPARRGPVDAREEWAMAGLRTLAVLDPDGAVIRNEAGFNKADGWLGHQLAQRTGGGLSNAEWALAIGICKKYHRQIGVCPDVLTIVKGVRQ